jgi:adenosylcobinamide kinase / adenosylcobinamide-phosphate guanylyltransferase
MAEAIMVLGGSSSGKSSYAENLARKMQEKYDCQVYYLATGTIWDEEFASRVEKHRQRRPDDWQTVEEPCDLAGVFNIIEDHFAIVMVDGVGTWLSNMMCRQSGENFEWNEAKEKSSLHAVLNFIDHWDRFNGIIIMVADEVGMEIVPEYYQARIFRDLNGQVNQILARKSSRVYFVAAGIPICLKGGDQL